MILEQALFEYLSAASEISSLVADRIYPVKLPEKVTIPALVFHRVDTRRIYTHDPFPDPDPWITARVQFDCWGRSAEEAIDLGVAILMVLSGYDGPLGGSLTVGSSFAVDEVDLYEAATKFYRRVVDMTISYEGELEDDEEEASSPGVAQPDAVGGSGST